MKTRPGVAAGPLRLVAATFLTLEANGALAWWIMLSVRPASRALFLPAGAPSGTLLAFVLPDLVLYVGAALAGAWGLLRRRPWGWPMLCVHCGAGCYAALYGLALPIISGGGWAGALLMSPSLLVLPWLVWRLRPERGEW